MKILVVGASGKLGGKIVRELMAIGASNIRVTHRSGSNAEQVTKLRASGAELCEADLSDEASLGRACEGVEVVISAVQGLRDVIVDGQTRLLRAAEKAGVKRMIPSDYSLDFFKTSEGKNRNLDLRRELNRTLDGSSVRGNSVLCGAFMDLLAMGAMSPDPKTGIYRVWGDADQIYDFTHTDDVAKYVAAIAIDDGANRIVRVVGDSKSPRQMAAIFQELRGVPVKIESAGSLADLEALIAKMRAADEAPTSTFPVWQQLQYGRDMASGLGKLEPIDNARYASVRPRSIRTLLETVPAPAH